MKKTVEIFGRELAGMRAGRAHPALLEKVQVEYYGTPTPLQHLATITAPEPRSLVVQPFDRGAVGTIEKALLKADLGVSVRVDGAVLRVTVPPLTEERRKDLVRQLKRRAEEEKVAVRNIRREALEELRAAEKEHQISEDELRRAESEMQKLTDRYTKEIDQLAEAREQDILTP
ncbi:MAG: ribosome recycling factor [Firmicutes bacterium]|nr:ribosome recycling factor [Bacillota bacterium]